MRSTLSIIMLHFLHLGLETAHYFGKQFATISVGRVTLDYFTYVNDTFTLNAVNKSRP